MNFKKLVSFIDFFISDELHLKKNNSLGQAERFRRQRLIITTSFVFGFLILLAFLARLGLEGYSSSKSINLNLIVIPLFLVIGPLLSKFFNLQTLLPWISLFAGNFVVVMRSIDTGGIKSPIFLWIFIVPAIAGILIHLRAAVFFFFLMSLQIIIFSMPEVFGLKIQPFRTPESVQAVLNFALMFCFFAVAFFYEKQRLLNEKLIQGINQAESVKRRMTSLTRLSGGLAHEINNPLTIVKNRLKTISRYLNEGNHSQVEYSLERADESLNRIELILKKLRLFTKEEDINLQQHFTWYEIIQEARQEVLPSNPIHLIFELDVSRSEEFKGNKNLMKQVFISLIENSVRATQKSSERWIRVSLSKDPTLVIRVTDSGPKLDEEIAEFILDPFFTTEDVGRGTGLGLTTASAICHLHGGELGFNKDAKNTEFFLTFPL